MRFGFSLPLHGSAAHPEGAEMSGAGLSDAQRFAERFDPFHNPYLADPYPFFAEARAATPVFYSPDLDYWVVTRYHDIGQIFPNTQAVLRCQHPRAAAADLPSRRTPLG
jgi:hypothetical protein